MSMDHVETAGGQAGAEVDRQPSGGVLFLALIGMGVVGTLLWWALLVLAAIQIFT